MKKLIKFLKPYKKECILGPFFKLLEAVLELALPTIMAVIINTGVNKHNMNYVLKMGTVMLIMAMLGFCCSLTCQYFAAKASQGFGTNLRNNLFQHISSFSYAEIDKFGTSSLINRITSDVNQLQLAVAMLIRLAFRAPFICIGAIVMSMMLDLKLSLILIACTPIFGFILYLIINKSSPLYTKYQKKLDNIGLILRENLSGVRVIRAFVKTNTEEKKFIKANDDLTSTGIHVGKISALLSPITSFVMNAAIIALLWSGSIRINSGRLSNGVIIAFVNYINQILLALIVVSNLSIIFTKAFASANRINEILETYPSIADNENNLVDDPNYSNRNSLDPIIQFKNVFFGYNSTGEAALSNTSVTINTGETIGIIGSTGTGKSTFINLISRFYDVQKGEILIKGKNIKDYNLFELRKKIGLVPQKSLLFTGTIAENIRWGKQDASDEEIKTAAKIAQAEEFISQLPNGYNTMVARGGQNFSGGQKQRLTIARAIVSKPEILILDDSSSALDFATDANLRKAIKENCKNTTVLIISQRASTIKQADKILVFDDGRIISCGTHEQLIKDCEIYKEICASQLSSKEV